jgi:heptosyltransferase-2
MPAALRILVVRFSSLGDVLLTTPLIRALRARHPDATLAALTSRACAPLFAGNPRLDEVLALEPGESLPALARRLRRRRFTHLLDLHGSLRSRVLRLLVPGRWRGFDPRRGPRRELIRHKRDIYPDRLPVAERYFEAARDLGVEPDGKPAEFFASPRALAAVDEWLGGADTGRGLVALAPGAAHPTKRWPLAHWERLAASLARQGWLVAVLGGPEDAVAADVVARAAGERGRNAAGRFDLQGAGALLARARVAVAGDTGLMHLATAVGAPVVALFGPTVEQFGFFPYRARAVVLERDLPCRPCSSKGGRACPLGHHRCLAEIVPDQVLPRVLELAS